MKKLEINAKTIKGPGLVLNKTAIANGLFKDCVKIDINKH